MNIGRLMRNLKSLMLLVAIALTCTGCGLPVSPESDLLLKDERPRGIKLTTVSIEWEDSPSIPIRFNYSVSRYQKENPPPPGARLLRGLAEDLGQLVRTLKARVPARLKTALEGAGVGTGPDFKITVRPESAMKFDNHLGLSVILFVRIVDSSNREAWSGRVHSSRGYNLIGIDLTDHSDTYADNAILLLMARLRKAELIQ